MTVDEILATGRYRDRRGRLWKLETDWSTSPGRSMWTYLRIWTREGGPVRHLIDTAQMRLLIERDMHRDSCVGLRQCYEHPVPHVVRLLGQFDVYRSGFPDWDSGHETIGTAMDAARALAVGE